MNKKTALILPHLALFVAVIFWGSSFIMTKTAYKAYHPNLVMFGRLALASLFFIPFLRGFKKQYRKGDWPYLVLMALFEPVLYFTFEARALELTTASQAGMIVAIMPLLVAIPSYFLLKEKITPDMILGFTLAIGGSVLLTITADSTEQGPNPPLGNILEFLAMVSATGYVISSRKLSNHYTPGLLTAVQCGVGTLYFLIRLLISRPPLPESFPLGPTLSIAMLGILVSLGAYALYNFGIAKTSATQSALYLNLIPIIALVLSLIILKEPVKPIQYVASTIIMSGVLVSQSSSFRKLRLKRAS